MLPIDLEQKIIKLPDTKNHNIIIITGNSLRHNRFAYRIQKEFGELVLAWYELDNNVSPKFSDTNKKEKQIEPTSRVRKILYLIGKELPLSLFKYGVFTTLKRIYKLGMRVIYNPFLLRKYYKDSFKAEKTFWTRNTWFEAFFNNSDNENRYLVLVGNKVNLNPGCTNNVLFRIIPPKDDGTGLIKYLRKIPIKY